MVDLLHRGAAIGREEQSDAGEVRGNRLTGPDVEIIRLAMTDTDSADWRRQFLVRRSLEKCAERAPCIAAIGCLPQTSKCAARVNRRRIDRVLCQCPDTPADIAWPHRDPRQ